MIVSIHQPNYLPWIGFFDKINKCDAFVLLDNVQFVRDLYQQRTRIKTAQGWSWLTVPVIFRFEEKPEIRNILIDNKQNWRPKHWRALQTSYGRAPFFPEYREAFKGIYEQHWEWLADLNEAIIRLLAETLMIRVPILRASELEGLKGSKTELLISICNALGADAYLSGPSGRHYLDEAEFQRRRIDLLYHEFEHPVYPQLFGEFAPYMSSVDLLFNQGAKAFSANHTPVSQA